MKKLFFTAIIVLSSLAVFSQTKLSSARTPEEKLNEAYATGLFQSAQGTILDVASSPSALTYFNILSWLEGKVPGLWVQTTRSGVRVPIMRNQPVTVYVDEIMVNASYLNALPGSEIAMIKVIKGPFVMNPASSAGALAIYTFQTEEEEND
jgi:hypothetical protein